MSTLLFQLVGPLQAWDTQSHLDERLTEREPSKSGVIGLLCAALGIERDRPDELSTFTKLKMGVRIDREGYIIRDFHTAGKDGYVGSDGKVKTRNLITSTRYYLADAMFLVGLEGDSDLLLKKIQEALQHPKWILFLGRKSCAPSRPPYLKDGFFPQSLEEAIEHYPWLGQSKSEYDSIKQGLRFVYDEPKDGDELHNDLPTNFARNQRHFQPRQTKTMFISRPKFKPEASYPLVRQQEATP